MAYSSGRARPAPTHKPKPGEATLRKIRRSTVMGSASELTQRVRDVAIDVDRHNSKPAPFTKSHSNKNFSASSNSLTGLGRGSPLSQASSGGGGGKMTAIQSNPLSSSLPSLASVSTPPAVPPRTNTRESATIANNTRPKSGSRIGGSPRHYQDAPIKLSRMNTAPNSLNSIPTVSAPPSHPPPLPPSHSPPPLPTSLSSPSLHGSAQIVLPPASPINKPRVPSLPPPVLPQNTLSHSTILTLNVCIPEHSIDQTAMQFSAYSSVNEALQQILLLLLNLDAGPDVLRNYAIYTPPLEGESEGYYLTAERTLQSYCFTDGDVLEVWERPQAPTLVKIEAERASMTFKVDEDTTVWFIVVKLLKKLQTRNASEYIKGKPQEFGLFLCHTYLDQEILLDEDAFITSFNVTSHTKMVFKKKASYVEQGDLELRLLNDWDGINYKSVLVNSNLTVFAALKKLVKIHPVSDYNQYGLYYIPPNSTQGFFLEEDQILREYGLQQQEFIEFKKKYRAYAVKMPFGGELVYKLDESATAKQLFDLVMYNCSVYLTADKYWLFVRGGPMIDMSRGLWSYPVCSKVGLELKVATQPLNVWYEKNKYTFEIDYSEPLDYVLPYIFESVGSPYRNPGEFTLIQLNVAGILLDTSKSLLEQGVSHNGMLLLSDPSGSCPIPVIRQHDEQLAVSIWDEPTNSSTVIYDTKVPASGIPNIEAATLNKIVERLTSPASPDLSFMKAFVMTYLSFTTPTVLFAKLTQRFHAPPTCNAQEKEIVQFRVCNTLKYWIETRYQDFSHELTMDVLLFIDQISQRSETKRLGRQLREAISKRTSGMKDHDTVPSVSSPAIPPANSRLNSDGFINGKPTETLFDFDPLVVARVLTLTDSKYYLKIEPTELLNQCWSKPEVQHLAPNILAMIDRFNMIGGWVASLILTVPKVKQRAARFEYILKVAEQLKGLNNFFGLMAIISGLNHASIQRIKFTKAALSKKAVQTLKDLETLMSAEGSFKTYRNTIRNANPPCVPYLAVYLKDLTFIEDGNNNKINDLINFGKRRLLYAQISEMQQYQQIKYPATLLDQSVDSYLSDISALPENDLYNISLQLEPRNATKVE